METTTKVTLLDGEEMTGEERYGACLKELYKLALEHADVKTAFEILKEIRNQ